MLRQSQWKIPILPSITSEKKEKGTKKARRRNKEGNQIKIAKCESLTKEHTSIGDKTCSFGAMSGASNCRP
jgi:hypothetical protein